MDGSGTQLELVLTHAENDEPASGQPALHLEIVRTLDGVSALRPDYAHLNAVCANQLPFALHDWHRTWCRHFLNRHARIQDQPLFLVFRADSGECVAIIPFILSRRRMGPFGITSINMLGADPAITEIRTPLIAPGFEAAVAGRVHAHLHATLDWDWVHWNGIGGAFGAALAQMAALYPQPALPTYELDLPDTWEKLRAGLKRNIRESLRHCYNSLKREGHAFELRVVCDAADVRGAVDRFLELHGLRAGLDRTTVHPNRFASGVSQAFLREICEQMAAAGRLRIFELLIGGEVVATRIGFLVGESLYLYYSGFHPDWGRFSVMTTTVAEAIKYAISNGVTTVNLSTGTDVSKTRWGPREVPYAAAHQHSGRLRSRLASHAYLRALTGVGIRSRLLNWFIPTRRVWR